MPIVMSKVHIFDHFHELLSWHEHKAVGTRVVVVRLGNLEQKSGLVGTNLTVQNSPF